MPRTKAQSASKENINHTIVKQENEVQNIENLTAMLLSALDQEYKLKRMELKNQLRCALESIDNISFEEFTASVVASKAHKSISELQNEKSYAVNATTFSELGRSILKNNTTYKSFNSTSNNTHANTGRKKKQTEDEGYLTAGESGRSVSTDRISENSRSRSTVRRNIKKTRESRSLSRSKFSKNVTIQAPDKKTPEHRMIPPNTYGLVTPKAKPNTPLSILRRPKQGEMAISMQGSPLLVSGVVTETCANVNIPLEDGRILSLQPSRSLRMSEIPNLDEHTLQQLLTLRDNLNKVVKLAGDC